MPITRLGVRNFRCIQNMDLNLPPLTVVIGPNGAGKSTFLHCVQMLSRSAKGDLKNGFSQFGGFDATLCRQSDDSEMVFSASTEQSGAKFDYNLILEKEQDAYYVATEMLERKSSDSENLLFVLPFQTEPGKRPVAETSTSGFLLRFSQDVKQCIVGDGSVAELTANRPYMGYLTRLFEHNRDAHPFQRLLCSVSFWKAVDLSLQNIRRPQELEPAASPSAIGDNLLSVLYTLKTERRAQYEEMLESLQVAFPELDSLELPLAGKGYASLNWYQSGQDRPLYANQLSDGTLRLLWLVTLLYTAPEDTVLLIDEPEISLHPQWLMFLVGLLRQTSARTQIIVATHSDQLIRWLEPHELLVADMEDGVSRFRWGSDMDLDEWLKEYTLDRLWLMGELGGRR